MCASQERRTCDGWFWQGKMGGTAGESKGAECLEVASRDAFPQYEEHGDEYIATVRALGYGHPQN